VNALLVLLVLLVFCFLVPWALAAIMITESIRDE
jgi:hypothetical protein